MEPEPDDSDEERYRFLRQLKTLNMVISIDELILMHLVLMWFYIFQRNVKND